MCCAPRPSRWGAGPWGYCCCPCGCLSVPRHFLSRKEEREVLERYKEELKKELAGVEEQIKELGK